jgi:uncharacterized BrkB/YihY/UPF0761 family membrane protein
VEPVDEKRAQEPRADRKRLARTKLWAGAMRARAERLEDRAQAERRRHDSVDVVFEAVDRDGEVGGGIIAGALAYRFFIWLLPLALVAVAGLGFASETTDESPESTADSVGLSGLVSDSIARAADSPNRWYALLIGVPVLVWATRSLLRALIGAHRLVWIDLRSAAPKATVAGTVRLLVLLLGFLLVSVLASAVRAWSGGPGLVSTLLVTLPYAGIWLLASLRLPHRGVPWKALVPGALLFGVGLEVLNIVAAYVIAPWAITKQGTYGALGAAAALLLALFFASRLIVGAAVLNATLWERRVRATA